MLGGGKIHKRWVWTQKGKQHGWLFSNYTDGIKRFARGRKF